VEDEGFLLALARVLLDQVAADTRETPRSEIECLLVKMLRAIFKNLIN